MSEQPMTLLRVVRGGAPSPEALAALVVAVTSLSRRAVHGDDGRPDTGRDLPVWAAAGRHPSRWVRGRR